ncbi:murein biosynthesis integral membrane protein MurJ [Methylococcus sp. EFPC2]|uniref:murein biosynthesis integral membrane protein MurJ n=1 Tax=Methylococcus sp. EFPC2 TaxID=2812648 RepID=UPI001F086163|nr:murein biosynthesis integral membrane protein MurJ [Methylococcus sp. EFPC2]
MKSTAVVGLMTLVSRVLGFLRDMVIARLFGADAATDAFFVAFRIPNFLRRLFAEGSFAQAFVPLLAGHGEDRDGFRRLIDRATGALALLFLLATLAGVVLAPVLILVFAPGFLDQPGQLDLGSRLLQITFPYLFFVVLTAFAGAILNAAGRFAVPAFTPALLNLSMIAAAIWLAPHLAEPVSALAWGVLLAGLAQLVLQIPFLAAAGLLPRPRIDFRDAAVRSLLKRMGPAIFGVSVTQVNLLVDTLLASFLMSGSVSWLYYSDRLVEFPLGIFGVALGSAILPQLSKTHVQKDPRRFSHTLDWGLRWVLLIGLPATVGLLVLAEPLMATLFRYDEFGERDVLMASRSLKTYASGLVGFIAVKILAAGYGARHDLRTPVRYGIYAMLANALLGLGFTLALAPRGWGHAGLALATALAALLNAGLLLGGLIRARIYRPLDGWGLFLSRVILGNVLMGWLLTQAAGGLPWLEWGASERVLQLGLWIGAGGGAYFLALAVLGLRPIHLQTREAI